MLTPGLKGYISIVFHAIFSISIVAHILLSFLGNFLLRQISKPIPIISLSFMTGLVWAQTQRTKQLYVIATIVSAVADVLIDIQFRVAVALFFFVHLTYAFAFTFPSTLTQQRALQPQTMSTSHFRFLDYHYPFQPLRFIIPFLIQISVIGVVLSQTYNLLPIYSMVFLELYGFILSVEVWRAASVMGNEASFDERFYSKMRLIGSFLFLLSDLLVTIQAFIPLPFDGNQVYLFVIVSYYIAQYLINRATACENLYTTQFEPLVQEGDSTINESTDESAIEVVG